MLMATGYRLTLFCLRKVNPSHHYAHSQLSIIPYQRKCVRGNALKALHHLTLSLAINPKVKLPALTFIQAVLFKLTRTVEATAMTMAWMNLRSSTSLMVATRLMMSWSQATHKYVCVTVFP